MGGRGAFLTGFFTLPFFLAAVDRDRSFKRCRSAFALRTRRLTGFALATGFVAGVLALRVERRAAFELAAGVLEAGVLAAGVLEVGVLEVGVLEVGVLEVGVLEVGVAARRATGAFFLADEVRLLAAGLALAALTKARTNWSLRIAWTPVRPIFLAIADRSLTVWDFKLAAVINGLTLCQRI